MIHICSEFDKMDFTKVTEMLTRAYWSEGIQIDEVIKGASNSAVVVGAFLNGEQIGYARAVSDKTRFAYIADVYVDERYRQQGIGRSMVQHILDHESLKDVYQWLLITKDAHGVYRKNGFQPLAFPSKWMEIRKARSVKPVNP
jgi:GNAT superfamily N-acetyltransferase